jgi:hypothetical protein
MEKWVSRYAMPVHPLPAKSMRSGFSRILFVVLVHVVSSI